MERLEIPKTDGVTLLSAGEAEVLLSKEERAIGKRWWLRTEGSDSSKVAYVDENGDVNYDGIDCREKCELVPALEIKAPNHVIPGETFKISSMEFIVISPKLAMLNGSIKNISFNSKETVDESCAIWETIKEKNEAFNLGDLEFNHFEASDVKKYLDKWYGEIIKALTEHGLI